MTTDALLTEFEKWLENDFDGFGSERMMLARVAREARRLLTERVSYKAKLVDQRWEIEQAARKAERERCAQVAYSLAAKAGSSGQEAMAEEIAADILALGDEK